MRTGTRDLKVQDGMDVHLVETCSQSVLWLVEIYIADWLKVDCASLWKLSQVNGIKLIHLMKNQVLPLECSYTSTTWKIRLNSAVNFIIFWMISLGRLIFSLHPSFFSKNPGGVLWSNCRFSTALGAPQTFGIQNQFKTVKKSIPVWIKILKHSKMDAGSHLSGFGEGKWKHVGT